MLAAGITIAAAALTYAEIICSLNGSSSCFALPAAVDIVLIALLWPLILAFRFLMETGTIIVNTVGILLSFAWVYFLLCIVRWGIGKWKK